MISKRNTEMQEEMKSNRKDKVEGQRERETQNLKQAPGSELSA